MPRLKYSSKCQIKNSYIMYLGRIDCLLIAVKYCTIFVEKGTLTNLLYKLHFRIGNIKEKNYYY